MTLRITGTKSLIKRLQKGVSTNDVREAVKLHATMVQKSMQRYVPVDTGALKRSITIDILDTGYTAKIYPTMEYASYVEYGTRKQTAQPYIRPSIEAQGPKFVEDIRKLLR